MGTQNGGLLLRGLRYTAVLPCFIMLYFHKSVRESGFCEESCFCGLAATVVLSAR